MQYFSFFLKPALAMGLLLTACALQAGGLQVTPTTLQLLPEQNAEGIWLSNAGDTPLHAQVRVFAWSQRDGADMLEPSTGLMVSPPMLQLAPGARQLLRVIRSGPAPAAGQEQAFRIIVDELPVQAAAAAAPAAAGAGPRKPAAGINFTMRYSLPVFVGSAPGAESTAALAWSLSKSGPQWTVTVRNNGSHHAQIADLQAVLGQDQRTPLSPGLLGYALPGSTMQWRFDAPRGAAAVKGYEAMLNRAVQPIEVREVP